MLTPFEIFIIIAIIILVVFLVIYIFSKFPSCGSSIDFYCDLNSSDSSDNSDSSN